MNNRLLSFLGLCRRAGYMILGADTVIKAIKEGKALLVLTADDLSPNSARDIGFAAGEKGVELKKLGCGKDELSFAVGKYCGVVCITDRGFAEKILEMIEKSEE